MRKSLLWAAVPGLVLIAGQAKAVPAFASQTGQACSACHVGSYGPELTPFGRSFKLGGYTLQGGDGKIMPLSMMVLSSYTNTDKNSQGPAAPQFGSNGNFAVDQISAFLGGRVNSHLGGMVQGTFSGVDKSFYVDDVDIRAVSENNVGNHDVVWGMSFNNAPQVEDVYNSTYTWGYPFVASALSNTPMAGTLIATGAVAGNTLGAVAYASIDQTWLVEAGSYVTQAPGLMKIFGESYGAGASTGLMPYARAVYDTNIGPADVHIGTNFLSGRFNPTVDVRTVDPAVGHDTYTDFTVDGGAQFLNDTNNEFTTNGLFTHEWRHLDGSTAQGLAMTPTGDLNDARLTGTYYYKNTYGLTAAWSRQWGSRDTALYNDSLNGKPDSNAYILEADYVPFGKDSSWGAPFANLKIGLQYTIYTEFNGGTTNYDGTGRNASDNNTLYLFLWTIF